MPTLAVYHTKGGVGKTATAVNLAYLAAQSGAHTLLCDLDPQSAATFYFRVKPKLTSGSKTFIKGGKYIERVAEFNGRSRRPPILPLASVSALSSDSFVF